MSTKSIAYRPEIDGLRAVCVLGVMIYHTQAGLTGGFVGVDIFFVISGFLIAKIILSEIRAGTFSLAGFWERRIRRIFPAVLFMNAAVLTFALFIYFPVDYYNLLVASRSLVFGVPNFHYWKALDYFADASVMFPLLHTWSLGVEEQFYVFFPLLVATLARKRPNRLFPMMAAIAGVSFAISLYQVRTGHAPAAFFLLPARAWELLAGCMLAMVNPFERLNRRGREAISIAGLACMIGTMIVYHDDMSFPGANAVLPVLAACGFIAANAPDLTISGQCLTRKGLVKIGGMSFSLYLWHWPLITFATLYFPERAWVAPAAALASFPVAWFSWRHVEEPFRGRRVFVTRRAVFRFFLTANACLIAFAMLGQRTNGFHHRVLALPETAQKLYRDALNDFTFDSIPALAQEAILTGPTKMLGSETCGEPRFFLWGDSHAMAVSHTFDEVARQFGISGLYAFSLGLDIVPAANPASYAHMRYKPNTVETDARILERIASAGIRNIVLINRWSRVLDDSEGPEDMRRFLRLIREKAPAATVYVFQEVPEHRYRRRVLFYQSFLSEAIGWPFVFHPTDRHDYAKLTRNFEAAMAEMRDDRIVHVQLSERFFDANGQLVHRQGDHSLYVDEDHLSRHGSEHLARPMIESVLASIAESPVSPGDSVSRPDSRVARTAISNSVQERGGTQAATNGVTSGSSGLKSN